MWQKVSDFPLAAYLAIAGFFKGLKQDERGLSGVVVAILLILVAVLAIVLIWGFLGDWLQTVWARITNSANTIQ